MEIKFMKKDGAIAPRRASAQAAGYDLYAYKDTLIPHGRTLIPTGVSIALPLGYEGTVRPRSGFSLKGIEGVATNAFLRWLFRLIGKTRFRKADVKLGTIDSDYRGEIGVIIRNDGLPFIVQRGTRIAQLVISKHEIVDFFEVAELDSTERGDKGFNSTGTK